MPEALPESTPVAPSEALPEIHVDAALHRLLQDACEKAGGIDRLEAAVLTGPKPLAASSGLALLSTPLWRSFAAAARDLWRRQDYLVVRSLPVTADGSSLLLTSLALAGRFRTYRGQRIVKRFSMSPWTQDLSHTTREGDFHTDLNTEDEPPALTAIQCLVPDPGAPQYGQNRIARLRDLLEHLSTTAAEDLLEFLQYTEVTMRSSQHQSWTGRIVTAERLRFHPTTLRAAQQSAEVATRLEAMLAGVHQAALAVSQPFQLAAGDSLFVSNYRALHYRGECSAVFTKFPTDYQARVIFVLHLLDEPP